MKLRRDGDSILMNLDWNNKDYSSVMIFQMESIGMIKRWYMRISSDTVSAGAELRVDPTNETFYIYMEPLNEDGEYYAKESQKSSAIYVCLIPKIS